MEADKLAYFRDELKRKLNDKRNFLIESDRAVVIKADYPKSQYHFRVVAKEEFRDITQLTEEHLPLLDHMMDLANQIIEKQKHLESRNFLIGFKVNTFWNRLNLHVISDDFYSMAMKRLSHWNSFNSELFMPFQIAYMMLSVQGSIESISEQSYNKLRNKMPLRCNQCEFVTNMLLDLKAHLYQHWRLKEDERDQKKKVDKIMKMISETKLDEAEAKPELLPEEPIQTQPVAAIAQYPNENPGKPLTPQQQQAQNSYDKYINGPPVNMMNQKNPNNPFRNTPHFDRQPQKPPQPRFGPRGPMAPRTGPRFPHKQQHNRFRAPGFNECRQPHPLYHSGRQQFPNAASVSGGQAGPPGQQQGARPKWNLSKIFNPQNRQNAVQAQPTNSSS
ncbi:GM26841 [Drosophila sechellia]|uniref:GM26841 n=3 Tax=Drosophila sechellia TaxID=7238 RepID=B4IHV3_DROSE|nr:GM26841 [Drosophila sechellia]